MSNDHDYGIIDYYPHDGGWQWVMSATYSKEDASRVLDWWRTSQFCGQMPMLWKYGEDLPRRDGDPMDCTICGRSTIDFDGYCGKCRHDAV